MNFGFYLDMLCTWFFMVLFGSSGRKDAQLAFWSLRGLSTTLYGRCDASLLVIKDASKFSNDVCPIILAYIVACVLANVWDYVLEKGLSNFLCHDHFK